MTGKERHWKAGQTIRVLSVYVKEAGQQDTLNSAQIGQTIQNQPVYRLYLSVSYMEESICHQLVK